MRDFYKIANFPGVTGCIDCTNVRIKSPGGDEAEVFRNRKGVFSVNVQASSLFANARGRWLNIFKIGFCNIVQKRVELCVPRNLSQALKIIRYLVCDEIQVN